jgi:hypothetical protein
MSELSPAAQAVLDAWETQLESMVVCLTRDPVREALAAALRATVNQVLSENANPVGDEHDAARADQWLRIRLKMLTIAAELEAQ